MPYPTANLARMCPESPPPNKRVSFSSSSSSSTVIIHQTSDDYDSTESETEFSRISHHSPDDDWRSSRRGSSVSNGPANDIVPLDLSSVPYPASPEHFPSKLRHFRPNSTGSQHTDRYAPYSAVRTTPVCPRPYLWWEAPATAASVSASDYLPLMPDCLEAVCGSSEPRLHPQASPLPSSRKVMPRVVENQRTAFEGDAYFRRLSRESEVRYAAVPLERPLDQRRRQFEADVNNGFLIVVSFPGFFSSLALDSGKVTLRIFFTVTHVFSIISLFLSDWKKGRKMFFSQEFTQQIKKNFLKKFKKKFKKFLKNFQIFFKNCKKMKKWKKMKNKNENENEHWIFFFLQSFLTSGTHIMLTFRNPRNVPQVPVVSGGQPPHLRDLPLAEIRNNQVRCLFCFSCRHQFSSQTTPIVFFWLTHGLGHLTPNAFFVNSRQQKKKPVTPKQCASALVIVNLWESSSYRSVLGWLNGRIVGKKTDSSIFPLLSYIFYSPTSSLPKPQRRVKHFNHDLYIRQCTLTYADVPSHQSNKYQPLLPPITNNGDFQAIIPRLWLITMKSVKESRIYYCQVRTSYTIVTLLARLPAQPKKQREIFDRRVVERHTLKSRRRRIRPVVGFWKKGEGDECFSRGLWWCPGKFLNLVILCQNTFFFHICLKVCAPPCYSMVDWLIG